MKKIIFYITILLSSWACQKETEEFPTPALPGEEERCPLSFQPILPGDITYGTDILPMTRASEDTTRTAIANIYQAIIIKKINDSWYVDTVVKPRLTTAYNEITSIPVNKNTVLDPFRIELRPGTYKIGIFLNQNGLTFNKEVKPGAFVATHADLEAGKNALKAYTIRVQGETYDARDNRIPVHSLLLGSEVFSGSQDFEVKKNTSPGNTGISTPISVQMKRRVARFRFLLKVDYDPEGKNILKPSFGNTPYFFTATLTSPEGTYFCEGLDVLGQAYYAGRTSFGLFTSVTGDDFYSEKDKSYYQMTLNIPSHFPNHNADGPTFYYPFILVDKPLECTLQIDKISGQSGQDGYIFYHEAPIPYTLKPNFVNGIALEKSTEIFPPKDTGERKFETNILPGIDVSQSFHFYYEWNASKHVINKNNEN